MPAGKLKSKWLSGGTFASSYREEGYSRTSTKLPKKYRGWDIWRSRTVRGGKVTLKYYWISKGEKVVNLRFHTATTAKKHIDRLEGPKPRKAATAAKRKAARKGK